MRTLAQSQYLPISKPRTNITFIEPISHTIRYNILPDITCNAPLSPFRKCFESPAETALLKAAKEIGCRIQPGRPMMDFQVEAMSAFFDIERKDRSHG